MTIMKCAAIALGFLFVMVSPVHAGTWDEGQDIDHCNDHVEGHENATDLHMKFELDKGKRVTEATADGEDGTVEHDDGEKSTSATLRFDFDPAIARGAKVKVKIKAGGDKLSLVQCWWTYAVGRGASLLSVGPEMDSETETLLLLNSSEEAISGTVAFATRDAPVDLVDLEFGGLAGFGGPIPINVASEDSVVLSPPAFSAVLLMEVAVQGDVTGEARDAIFQYVTDSPVPTTSQWGLIILALLLLTAGKVVFCWRQAVAA